MHLTSVEATQGPIKHLPFSVIARPLSKRRKFLQLHLFIDQGISIK